MSAIVLAQGVVIGLFGCAWVKERLAVRRLRRMNAHCNKSWSQTAHACRRLGKQVKALEKALREVGV